MAIAYVGSGGGIGNNVIQPATISNTYAPTAGSLLVIVGSTWHSGSSPAAHVLTDTRGNTIPSPTVNVTGGGVNRTTIWILPSLATGGAGTFALSVSDAGMTFDGNLDVYEYSGCHAGGALDGSPASAGGTGTSLNSGNITFSSSGSMLFAAGYDSSHGTSLSDSISGFVQRLSNVNGPGVEVSNGGDSLGLTPGTYSNTITPTATSNGLTSSLIGIKAAGGGPPTSPTPLGGPPRFQMHYR